MTVTVKTKRYKIDDFKFPTFQMHLYMEYILYIPLSVNTILQNHSRIFLMKGCKKLKLSLRKFYGRHHDLINYYETSVWQMNTNMFRLFQWNYVVFSFMNYPLWSTWETRRMPLMEQELPPLPENLLSSQFSLQFVLFYLWFIFLRSALQTLTNYSNNA